MAENAEVLALRRRARRRLVGAAALVLFLVIVPPMVMDLEPKPSGSNLAVNIPKQDSKFAPTAPPPTVAKAPDPAPPAPTGLPRSAAVSGAGEPATAAPTVPVAPAVPAKPEPAKPAATKSDAAAKAEPKQSDSKPSEVAESFFVQLGVFANRQRADEIRARAGKEGLKVYAERVKVDAGEQTRLRAGPYSTKAAAEQARERLETLGKELRFQPGPVRVTERRS